MDQAYFDARLLALVEIITSEQTSREVLIESMQTEDVDDKILSKTLISFIDNISLLEQLLAKKHISIHEVKTLTIGDYVDYISRQISKPYKDLSVAEIKLFTNTQHINSLYSLVASYIYSNSRNLSR